jgi:hypothetical protein
MRRQSLWRGFPAGDWEPENRQAALPIAERVRTELHSTAKGLPITVIYGVAPGHPGALSFSQNQLNLSMADKGRAAGLVSFLR